MAVDHRFQGAHQDYSCLYIKPTGEPVRCQYRTATDEAPPLAGSLDKLLEAASAV